MIFSPLLADKVMSGEKTVTRRPVKGEAACRYQVGRTYAVQPGRGKKSIGRIAISSVHKEPLGNATREARAEGFHDFDAFRNYWAGLYGNFNPDQAVWRIAFELVETAPSSILRSGSETRPLTCHFCGSDVVGGIPTNVSAEHTAGCFYGSFLGAYSDRWHIPSGVECSLDHGDNPIRLEIPNDS